MSDQAGAVSRRPLFWPTVLDMASYLALTVLVAIALAIGSGALAGGAAPGVPALDGLVLASLSASLLAALSVWWQRRRSLVASLAQLPGVDALRWAILVGAGLQLFALGLDQLLNWLGILIEPSNIEPIEGLLRDSPLLGWFAIVAVAPFAEELFFRHVLLRRFVLAGRARQGLVVSSLLFALMHELAPGEQTPLAIAVLLGLYTLLGAGLGWVYLHTGRLAASVLAHMVCNALALSALLLLPS